jgi:hypothetical protein
VAALARKRRQLAASVGGLVLSLIAALIDPRASALVHGVGSDLIDLALIVGLKAWAGLRI